MGIILTLELIRGKMKGPLSFWGYSLPGNHNPGLPKPDWAKCKRKHPNLHQQKAETESSAALWRADSPKSSSNKVKECDRQGRTSKKTKPVVLEMKEKPEAIGWVNPENYTCPLPAQRSLKFLPNKILFWKGTFYYSYPVPTTPSNRMYLCWVGVRWGITYLSLPGSPEHR